MEQHDEYVHGNPYDQRRVVLDSATIPEDLTVVPEPWLKGEVLSAVRQVAGEAAQGDQLLIMGFAHGDGDSYGLYLGADEVAEPDICLKPDELRAALAGVPEGLAVSTFFTSCFSSGWVLSEAMKGPDGSPIASIRGAGEAGEESISWNESISRRLGGSIFVSAVLRELMNEIPRTLAVQTYRQFTADVKRTLFDEIDLRSPLTPAFAAQEDRWDDPVHERTGIVPSRYTDRYNELRVVAPARMNPLHDRGRRLEDIPDEEWRRWEEDNATSPSGIGGRSGHGALPDFRSRVRFLAVIYMRSKPGQDNSGKNTAAHSKIKQLIRDELPAENYEEVLDLLLYRLERMRLVETYVEAMGLTFPATHEWDYRNWKSDPANAGLQPFYDEAYAEIHRHGNKLIPGRPLGVYVGYQKPTTYLAAACASARMDRPRLQQALARIVASKSIISFFGIASNRRFDEL